MISTKTLVSSINEVPRNWVFEYYLDLSEGLIGQDVKIHSPFNPDDKTPSFCVYLCKTRGFYLFKDFSKDKFGDGTFLVQELFNLSTRGEAAHKIMTDYSAYLQKNSHVQRIEIIPQDKYKVVSHKRRDWVIDDQKYWTSYKLGSDILEAHGVFPICEYVLEKNNLDGSVSSLVISEARLYGFFKADGELYKIYRPLRKEAKFVKVQSYTQGMEQLSDHNKNLIICSSMKDLLCFKALKFDNTDCIAPDSENVKISPKSMGKFQSRYKKIYCLFDNDGPGEKAALQYQKQFGVIPIYLKLDPEGLEIQKDKDLADCVKNYGLKKTKTEIINFLKQIQDEKNN